MTVNGSTHPAGSGPACDLCIAAETNPYFGEWRDGCFTCKVRYTSNLPAEARLAFYGTLATDADRELFATAVAAEYRRRRSLIANRSVQ